MPEKSKNDPASVETYLANLPEEQRESLEAVRTQIKTIVPQVAERISYGGVVMFSTAYDLVGIGAQKNHLSFFTASPRLAKELKSEITPTHKVSGATIHFSPDHPLPEALVEKIVRARVEENAARKKR